jgi:hypothetical protein
LSSLTPSSRSDMCGPTSGAGTCMRASERLSWSTAPASTVAGGWVGEPLDFRAQARRLAGRIEDH